MIMMEGRDRKKCWAGAATVLLLMVGSCNPVAEYQAVYTGDIDPPRFAGVEPVDATEVRLRFDEPVAVVADSVLLDGEPLEGGSLKIGGSILSLEPEVPFDPGAEYHLQGVFADEAGNSTSVATRFYGPNPGLPGLIINEFNPEGSSWNPDMIELIALEAGNVGGATLYEGSPSDWESRLVLPAVEVEAGAYILLHWKPEGIAQEVNELTRTDQSGGINAHDGAWDFWLGGGDGFTNTNGSLVLCAYPGGPMLDAVIFSTKRFDPEDRFRGFARSSILLRNEEIVSAGEWEIQGEVIVPEDAIDPEDSSATRSINRTPGAEDTNSPADWHIVPSSGATFGYENSTDRY
jgi:hypothetical protein